MDIKSLKKLSAKPRLYEKGTSVMWTDPHISKQLLELHINPEHDVASRSRDKIELVSEFILDQANKSNINILDMGCGPGLYAEHFAKKGYSVTGIDFSENSIKYAKQHAKENGLNIEYHHMDYLNLDYENEFDLVILIYMDFCALIPDERDKVLENVHKALKQGGMYIFDVVNEKNIDKKIIPQSWDIQEKGFWKDSPHMVLNNGYHYPEAKVLANHHIVMDDKDNIETYIFWNHYYTKNDIIPILESKGFSEIVNHENILPESDCWNGENVTFYVAQRALKVES